MDKNQVEKAILDFFGLVGRENSKEYTFIGGSALVIYGYSDTKDIDVLSSKAGFEHIASAAKTSGISVDYGTIGGALFRRFFNERLYFEFSGINFDVFRMDCVKNFLSSDFDKREQLYLNNFPIYIRPIENIKADIAAARTDLDKKHGLGDELICARRATLASRESFCSNYLNVITISLIE